jgi:hypothetical protein
LGVEDSKGSGIFSLLSMVSSPQKGAVGYSFIDGRVSKKSGSEPVILMPRPRTDTMTLFLHFYFVRTRMYIQKMVK